MKKMFLLLVTLGVSIMLFGQKKEEDLSKYRRNSLCLMLLDEEKMPNRDTIKMAFLNTPIPVKYNDHNVAERVFSPDTMTISNEDRLAFNKARIAGRLSEEAAELILAGNTGEPKKKSFVGGLIKDVSKSAAHDLTGGLIDTTTQSDYAIKAYKYLCQKKVAKQLFDKWFLNEAGNFSTDMMCKRGMENASYIDQLKVADDMDGNAILKDAGKELVGNTFVAVSRYHYLSKDELCAQLDAAAQAIASQINGYAALGAKAAMAATKAAMGAGYYIRVTTYLYQLNWNDSISDIMLHQLWNKPEAYTASDIFNLKYIGEEKAWAQVKAGIFTDKSEEELIRIATVNATDGVLAKLEKKYDVFKTKTPIIVDNSNPKKSIISAKIGTKEGVKAGDEFEVLVRVYDEKTKTTSYKRVDKVTVDKNHIWDNQYMADEERAAKGEKQDIQETRFIKAKNKLQTGMLLKQKK